MQPAFDNDPLKYAQRRVHWTSYEAAIRHSRPIAAPVSLMLPSRATRMSTEQRTRLLEKCINDSIELDALRARLYEQDRIGRQREAQAQRQAAIRNEPLLYVNLCHAYSAYGGREEGGWYYDAYEPIDSTAILWPYAEGWGRREIDPVHLRRLLYTERALLRKHGLLDAEPYKGHGVGGCGDDAGLIPGQSMNFYNSDEYTFMHTTGRPYEPGPRPHYE